MTFEQLIEFDHDKPRPFSLQEFYNHIFYLHAARVQGGALQSVTASDFATKFKSILDKLSVLRRDPRIRFMMREWNDQSPSLEHIIAQLVGQIQGEGGVDQDIRILDISGLPNEVAGPLAAMLARLLFQYKVYQTTDERRRDPVVLVGEGAAMPARVRIRDLTENQLPKSETAKFAKGWILGRLTEDEIAAVANRMAGEVMPTPVGQDDGQTP